METIRIQIKNIKALKILEDLEDLEILKVLRNEEDEKSTHAKLSEKYAGVLSSETAEEMNNYVNESRKEWERDT